MAQRNDNTVSAGQRPVRLLGTGARRWRWISVCLGLVVAGALGSMWAVAQADQRQGVLVATKDVPAGHTLGPQDVRVVQMAGVEDLAAIPSDDRGAAMGKTVAVPLTKDSLVAKGALVEAGQYPEPGQAVVGASLKSSQYPRSLEPGAQVAVITAQSGEQGPSGGDEDEAQPSTSATAQVQSISAGRGDGATRVELKVADADARQVARAAAANELVLVQAPDSGGT